MNKVITLGAGCFWGAQAYFDLIKGVVKTIVGYANGNTSTTNYQEVCKGNTSFIEVCQIEYNPSIISLTDVLNHFWKIVDPTLENRQAYDIGSQYQTAILYSKTSAEHDLPIILESRKIEQTKYSKPIKTLINPLKLFVKAENYHQKYLQKNPGGYCHIKLPINK